MEKQEKKSMVKVVLSSGKTVLLHELQIKHTEIASKQIANEAGDNAAMFKALFPKALLGQLIYKINDKVVTMAERDDFDSILKFDEYGQLISVVSKMSGGENKQGEAKVELVFV